MELPFSLFNLNMATQNEVAMDPQKRCVFQGSENISQWEPIVFSPHNGHGCPKMRREITAKSTINNEGLTEGNPQNGV